MPPVDVLTYDLRTSGDRGRKVPTATTDVAHLLVLSLRGPVRSLAQVPRGAVIACDTPAAAVAARVAMWAAGSDADAFRFVVLGSDASGLDPPTLAAGLVDPRRRSDNWLDVVPLDAMDVPLVRAMLPYAAVTSTTTAVYSRNPREALYETLQLPVVLPPGEAPGHATVVDVVGTVDLASAFRLPPPRESFSASEGDSVLLVPEGTPRCDVLEARRNGLRRLRCRLAEPVRPRDVVVLRSGPDRGAYGVVEVQHGNVLMANAYAVPPGARWLTEDVVALQRGTATPGTGVHRLPVYDAGKDGLGRFRADMKDGTSVYVFPPRVRPRPVETGRCAADSECPYFRGDIRVGGCMADGSCRRPVGQGSFEPLCYGCSPRPGNAFCCGAQGERPDYVFEDDAPARLVAGLTDVKIDVRSLLPRENGRASSMTTSSSASAAGPKEQR